MQLDRHQIVYLDPAAWSVLIGARPDFNATAMVADWAHLRHPLIARRPMCSDEVGVVPLGLPLPPSLGKQRLAFAVRPEAVVSADLPPLLADVIETAPAAWRATLDALVMLDADVRCFGSLAWQYLTGLAYLSATSDIDLLWHVSCADHANRLVADITRIEARAPMRLDGEIVVPGGAAIQWREWAAGAPELLAKDRDGARMIARDRVFA